MHEVERKLELLRPLEIDPVFDMRLFLRDADARWWAQQRSECGLDGASGTYAVIAPATSRPGKRWPLERWAELLGPLLHRHMHRIVLIGRESDHEQLRPLRELAATFREVGDSPLIDLVGETDVGRMMAVIASAGLVIANDTAPLHLAAALDRPCLGLYGPTDPALTGPFRQPDAALRVFRPRPGELVSPTDPKLGDALMRVISTATVIQAIDRVMANASRAMNDRHVEHAPSPIGTEGGRP